MGRHASYSRHHNITPRSNKSLHGQTDIFQKIHTLVVVAARITAHTARGIAHRASRIDPAGRAAHGCGGTAPPPQGLTWMHRAGAAAPRTTGPCRHRLRGCRGAWGRQGIIADNEPPVILSERAAKIVFKVLPIQASARAARGRLLLLLRDADAGRARPGRRLSRTFARRRPRAASDA